MTFNKGKRILVCGDRNWTDYNLVERILIWHMPLVIIEGGAKGADTCAREVAMSHNIPYEEYRARWEEYGKSAGPIRNRQMIKEGKPDVVFAFHDNLDASKGTKDMIKAARKAGLSVWIFDHHSTVASAQDALTEFFNT